MDTKFPGTEVSKKKTTIFNREISFIRPGAKSEGLAQIRTGVAGIFDQSKSGVITTTLQTRIYQNGRIARREASTYTTIMLLRGLTEIF